MADQTDKQAEELDILAGLRTVTIQGEAIEVREFSFTQEMQVLPLSAPIIREMAEVFTQEAAPDELAIDAVFARHAEALYQLLAVSIDRPVDWIKTLPGQDGSALLMTFWSVNRHFFIRRVTARYIMDQSPMRQRLMNSLSGMSSPH